MFNKRPDVNKVHEEDSRLNVITITITITLPARELIDGTRRGRGQILVFLISSIHKKRSISLKGSWLEEFIDLVGQIFYCGV